MGAVFLFSASLLWIFSIEGCGKYFLLAFWVFVGAFFLAPAALSLPTAPALYWWWKWAKKIFLG
jgi:hypothetical protein